MKDEWRFVLTKLGAPFVQEVLAGGGILTITGDRMIVKLCADNLDIWN